MLKVRIDVYPMNLGSRSYQDHQEGLPCAHRKIVSNGLRWLHEGEDRKIWGRVDE